MTTKDIPENYVRCFAADGQCGRCGTCLRSIAARMEAEELAPVVCVHPRYVEKVAGGQECEYYREQRTVRVAYGFVHMFEGVPEKLAQEARSCIKEFYSSRTSYYRSRSGELPIPPEEQDSIRGILRSAGIEDVPEFDLYEDVVDW